MIASPPSLPAADSGGAGARKSRSVELYAAARWSFISACALGVVEVASGQFFVSGFLILALIVGAAGLLITGRLAEAL